MNEHLQRPDLQRMQIEQINNRFFLDFWAGNGWKNIGVFKTYDEALSTKVDILTRLMNERTNQ